MDGQVKYLKYNKVINLVIILILSYVMGSLLIIYGLKYLSHITIINTFAMFLYIYIFQFIIQSLKVTIIKDKFNSFHNLIFKDRFLIFKFTGINFLYFLLTGIGVLGFLLLSLFFSNLKYMFIIFMLLCISVLHIIYTLCTLYIKDNSIIKRKLIAIKNYKGSLIRLVLINLIITSVLFFFMNFIAYFKGMIFVIIVLIDLLLNEINKIYLYNKF